MKLKLMNMAAMALSALLCLTTTGAWAGKLEPLTTILSADNTDFESDSRTFDDIATVTISGNVINDNDYGWYSDEGTLTVTAAVGYTINRVKFYTNNDGSGIVVEAPFEAILVWDEDEPGNIVKVNGTSIGQTGVTKIEVYGFPVAVTGVTLAPTSATLTLGETETVTLTATVDPGDAKDKSVTWSSSNGAVATVSNEGVVTAVAAGEATITVTTTDGEFTATCTVTVAAPEPAQPEWVQDGDTWDDATKTLTVNSDLPEEAYRENTEIENVVISDAVTSIGDGAFYECTGLTSITIGNNVTSIGIDAFYGCTGLTSVTIGNSVTSIGNEAFYGCTGLTTSITIPNSVTSIGNSAFYECAGLTSVTIPNSVTSIGSEAFFGCSGLTNIVVASENTTYDSRDNCNAIIETSSNTLVVGCKNTIIPNSVTSIGEYAFAMCSLASIEIPNSVTSIGDGAFMQCTGLTSVTIPNSVTSIGVSAFAGCTGLTSIEIPNNVTSIGQMAFMNCSNLESVTIPNSVTSIGIGAFMQCTGLTSVTNYAVTPQTINYAFYNVNTSSCTLYVPAESVSAYSAADFWKEFGNIQAIPEPTGYSVSLKEGTDDASNWTAKAGEGEYQALPLVGVAADTAVTIKYNGTKKVKSVKAIKK